jgi:hypothetical protein
MLPPHIKRKKCKKKFYFLPHENTTHRREKRDAKKKEKRKEEKEEGRPRCRAAGHQDPPLGLADHGSTRPTVMTQILLDYL